MAWYSLDGWDAAGAGAELTKAKLENVASSINQLVQAAKELAKEETITAIQAHEMTKAWDKVTTTLYGELTIVEKQIGNQMMLDRIDTVKTSLSNIDWYKDFINTAKPVGANIDALAKNLGATVSAAEVLWEIKKSDVTSFEVGSTAMGALASVLVGAGIATLALPGLVGIGIAVAGGLAAGMTAKYLWEKGIAPALGLSEKDSPLFWDSLFDSLGNLIDDLQKLFNQAETITSPLILDLDGSNGVETISKSAGVHFDLDGNKFAETTGWVGKNDGLLVLDKNGNGKIDNGSELFGNHTILKNGSKAANGFAALSELDINKDGKINASDSAYTKVRVWKNSNSNGVVDTGELLTLTQAGVKSLNTGFTEQTQTDAQGNQHLQAGSYTRTDGSTRAMNDVWFATDTARTIDQDLVSVNANIAALPELQGFGNVHSLHQAIARDTSGKLQNLVTQFSSTADTATRHALFDQILFFWSGADQYAANSRGGYVTDGRTIYAIEAFLGQRFVQGSGTNAGLNDPGLTAAAALQTIYDQLHQALYSQLMAQTHFKSLYDSINLSWNSTTNQFDIDVSATVKILETQTRLLYRIGSLTLLTALKRWHLPMALTGMQLNSQVQLMLAQLMLIIYLAQNKMKLFTD